MRKFEAWTLTMALLAGSSNWAAAADRPLLSRPAPKAAASNVDQQVADQVMDKLRDVQFPGQGVECEVKNGTCTLKGVVSDGRDKDRATAMAQSVPGVKHVHNQMILNKKLALSKALNPSKPKADSGVVAANHTAPAGDRARVQRVNFEQQLPAPPAAAAAPAAAPVSEAVQAANQQMADRVADALTRANLAENDIDIHFAGGVLFLSGQVSTPQERAAADQVSRQVPGVQQVVNQLQVGGQQPTAAPGAGYPQAIPVGYPGPGPVPGMAPGVNARPIGMAGGPVPPGAAPGLGPAPIGGYAGAAPGSAPPVYNQPSLPDYAWPAYAQYPNSAAVSYPQQYSANAFPYIGPFYPYPQVPLGWRDATLRWDDGQWNLQFRQRTDKWWWFMNPHNW